MLWTRLVVELKGDVLGSLEVGALWSRRSAFVILVRLSRHAHVYLMATNLVMIWCEIRPRCAIAGIKS
jgi:hypothetical protein